MTATKTRTATRTSQSEGRRSLTGITATFWTALTGQSPKRGRVEVVESDIRAAHAAATLASLRPSNRLAAEVATNELDQIGFREEGLRRGWANAADCLDVIVETFDDEDHARDMDEADWNEYGDQL